MTLLLALTLSAPALAGDGVCYSFEEVNVPAEDGGELYTSFFDVNDRKEFVGNFCFDPDCNPVGDFDQVVGGVIYNANTGTFTTWAMPDPFIYVGRVGINNRGEVVGEAYNGTTWAGFHRSAKGEITILPMPTGAVLTSASDINNAGVIVGGYRDADGESHGFRYWRGTYSDVTSEDMELGYVLGISNSGDMVGVDPVTTPAPRVAWVDYGWGPSLIEVTGSTRTTAERISDRGLVVGTYGPETGWWGSFLYDDGTYTLLAYDGAMYDTRLMGINNAGVLAGTFDFYSYGLIGWPEKCEE